MTSSNKREAWLFDPLSKSEFFHQKLHEWRMLETASTTILILPGVSVTTRAISALNTAQNIVNYWFILEELVEEDNKKEELFRLLAI